MLGVIVGCAADGQPAEPSTGVGNAPPSIVIARVDCDGRTREESWILFAEVSDPDGADDVREVTALVYDEVTSDLDGSHVLERLDGGEWEIRFPASSTALDCSFDRYSADFIAVDTAGESATTTIYVAADQTPVSP